MNIEMDVIMQCSHKTDNLKRKLSTSKTGKIAHVREYRQRHTNRRPCLHGTNGGARSSQQGSETERERTSSILCGQGIVQVFRALPHVLGACNFEFLFGNELIKTNHTKEIVKQENITTFYYICMNLERVYIHAVAGWDVEKVVTPTANGNKATRDKWTHTTLICMRARSGAIGWHRAQKNEWKLKRW